MMMLLLLNNWSRWLVVSLSLSTAVAQFQCIPYSDGGSDDRDAAGFNQAVDAIGGLDSSMPDISVSPGFVDENGSTFSDGPFPVLPVDGSYPYLNTAVEATTADLGAAYDDGNLTAPALYVGGLNADYVPFGIFSGEVSFSVRESAGTAQVIKFGDSVGARAFWADWSRVFTGREGETGRFITLLSADGLESGPFPISTGLGIIQGGGFVCNEAIATAVVYDIVGLGALPPFFLSSIDVWLEDLALTDPLCGDITPYCEIDFSFLNSNSGKGGKGGKSSSKEPSVLGVPICPGTPCEDAATTYETVCVDPAELVEVFGETAEADLPYTCGCCSPVDQDGSYPSYCADATVCAGQDVTACEIADTCDGGGGGSGKTGKSGKGGGKSSSRRILRQDDRDLRHHHEGKGKNGAEPSPVMGVTVCLDGQEVCLDPLEPKDVAISMWPDATCGPCEEDA